MRNVSTLRAIDILC